MKELKAGNLVYNKELGQGIVQRINENGVVDVVFVDHSGFYTLRRNTLFTKGDKVIAISECAFFGHKIKTFLGYTPFAGICKLAVREGVSGYSYVREIEHIEEPTIEITVKVNGKTVPLNSLSMDTLEKIRIMENNYE